MPGPNDTSTYPEDELRRFYSRQRALHDQLGENGRLAF